MNNITISGRIGRDAELRTTQGGMQVLSFAVASSKKVKGEEKTTWFDCSLFGQRAMSLQPYIVKGGQLVVSGSIELQTFQKNDGTQGAKIQVFVNDVDLVGGRPPAVTGNQPQQFQQQQPQQRGGNQGSALQPQQPQGFTGQPAQSADFTDISEDSIPF